MANAKIIKVEMPCSTDPFESFGKNERYIVIDEDTGETLDDAQGYGFKTYEKALACWRYKNRTPEQKAKRRQKIKVVNDWCRANKKVVSAIDDAAFYAWKDSEEFNAASVREVFAAFGINIKDLPFTAGDFLRYRDKKK